MAKIVRFHETGGPEVLKLAEEPLVAPKAGELRIKVEAIGLNRAESMFRSGAYLEAPVLPSRLGYEAAGTVDALGPDVVGFKIGDRVSTIPAFPFSAYGVYGTSAVVPVHAVAPIPDALSMVEGAAIWMQYLTAWHGLYTRGGLARGDSVLITAASSSVGLAAIQIVKAAGGTAIAATRTAEKKAALLDAGADHVIVTDDEDLTARTAAITGGTGVRIAFDPIGGPILNDLANAAANRGVILLYGALSRDPTPYPLFTALQKGLTISAFTLFECSTTAATLAKGVAYVLEGLKAGTLKPIIDASSYTLDDIVGAHKYLENNRQFGKIVVRV